MISGTLVISIDIWLAAVLILLLSTASCFKDCDLLLKKHTNIHGIGVYANRNFNRGEVVERCIAILIPSNRNSPILDEYVYGHRHSYVDVVLGYGMIYNHHSNESLHMHSSEAFSIRTDQSNRVFDFVLTALYDIKKGDEIFTSYGTGDGKTWFDERGMTYVNVKNSAQPPSLSLLEDHEFSLPGCPLSKTEVFQGHVYATQYILEGEVVEVSRALMLPVSTGDDNDLQRYLWYSNHSGSLNSSILVLGHGALYQASDMNSATLSYDWYFHEGEDGHACSDKMLVKFTATKDILPNMELTVPLLRDGLRRYVREEQFHINCF